MEHKSIREDPSWVFQYDETSPSCLRWKNPRSKHLIGKVAGTYNKKQGSWHVSFRGKPEVVKRVVWEMFHGKPCKTDSVVIEFGGTKPLIDYLTFYKGSEKNWFIRYMESGDWNKIFFYEGGHLYYLYSYWSGANLQIKGNSVGDRVEGHKDKDGYLRIASNCLRTAYRIHRIIYEIHFGKIPEGFEVDHINGDVEDNRIENLRAVTRAVNARNMKKSATNKTGVCGVCRRGNQYTACWTEDKRNHTKSFSIEKYGEDKAFELACKTREEKISTLNSLYKEDRYTTDHGKRQ